MVDTPQSNNPGAFAVSPQPPPGKLSIRTTLPDVLFRHNISDEQLTMLSEYKRDHLLEAKWAAAGGFFGSASPAISAIWDAYIAEPAIMMPAGDFVQVLIFFGALIAFGILQYAGRNKSRDVNTLVKAIRDRTRCQQESI